MSAFHLIIEIGWEGGARRGTVRQDIAHSKIQFSTLFNLIKVAREKIVNGLLAVAEDLMFAHSRCHQMDYSIHHFIMCTHTHTQTKPNQPNSSTIDTRNIKWYLVHEKGLMTAHLTCSIFHNSRGTRTHTFTSIIEIYGKNFIKKCKYFCVKMILHI